MCFLQKTVFSFIVLLCLSSSCVAQDTEGRDYWIDRYMSVSYPLKSIKVNSKFGTRRDPFSGKRCQHGGLDLQAKYEETMAMFDGVVENIGKDDRSGLYVILRHGLYTISYCHLSKYCVKKGDEVIAGDVIGITGNTGRSSGPHLHLTAKINEKNIDPYKLLEYIRDTRKEAVIALGGTSDVGMEPAEFLQFFAPYAMEQQKKYGIPTSVTLAQMAYESGWGQSELAKEGNNYFGIKASQEWLNSGKPYSCHDDDKKNEPFCNYNSVRESIEHHSELLMSKRYAVCRKYDETDYYNWLVGLKSAGYATDSRYVEKCVTIIKAHKLYKYDNYVAHYKG